MVWEQLASQLTSLVGEDGFDMLYARSVVLARVTFPWLELSAQPVQASPEFAAFPRFAKLQSSFDGQSATDGMAANSQLLITFTDIMAALIGEELTISALRSAWGHVVDQQFKGKKNG